MFTNREKNAYPSDPFIDGMAGIDIVKFVEAEDKREAVGSLDQARTSGDGEADRLEN